MDDLTVELSARITLYDFLFELLFANNLCNMNQNDSDKFKADMIERMSRPYGLLTGDLDAAKDAQKIASLAEEMMKHFVSKVASREADMRRSIPGL